MRHRGTLFWGGILIAGGILFLLDNMGLLPFDVWKVLWPLFLIALGAWFLFGSLIKRPPQVEHANVPLEGARRARLRIQHAAGRLLVASGAGPGDLAEGDFSGGVEVDARHEGDLLDVRLSVPNFVFPFTWSPGERMDWDVRLSRDVPLTLDLDTGANDARIDLSDLAVVELRLQSGASATEITLPSAAGMTHARIGSGAASVRVNVPPGVAGRIRAQTGLSSVQIDPGRFPRHGDLFISPDYDSAANRVDLEIDMGVGSVEVR